jgi:hypothetical protein
MSIFEQATRLKLRFDTHKGYLSVEDLWDLPLTGANGKTCLNSIAIDLHRELQDASPVSFVEAAPTGDPTVQLRFDLVKHVIDVRVIENKARADEQERVRKRARIMELIASKEDQVLADKSTDELRGLLASM